MTATRYRWFSLGDINSSATIVFDNLTNMAIIAFLLITVFKMPSDIITRHIIPGLSIGVACANFFSIVLAFTLAKKYKRDDITAFPIGLDSPSCIGLTLAITGPTFLLFQKQGLDIHTAALHSWYISCACTFFIGIVKLISSVFIHKIKHLLPTVALLGSLAGVSIGLISFFPLITMLEMPIVSLPVLAVIFMVYFADYKMPANLPAILVALIIGTIIYYLVQFHFTQLNLPHFTQLLFTPPQISTQFMSYFGTASIYLSIAIPFALLVIFGTLSVTESANVLGEKYSSKTLLFLDGIATIIIAFFGGNAQTTPYAGFPAYKKMNARSGYLMINILIVGVGSCCGFINYLINLIPAAALAPVLLFIGIEITMQVFLVCEKKYFPAAIFALFPSIARMLQIKLLDNHDLVAIDKVYSLIYQNNGGKFSELAAITILGNGFIVTGTIWAAIIYYLIEKRCIAAIISCIIAAIASLFGIIHSVNLDGSMYYLWSLSAAQRFIVLEICCSYLLFAFCIAVLHLLNYNYKKTTRDINLHPY